MTELSRSARAFLDESAWGDEPTAEDRARVQAKLEAAIAGGAVAVVGAKAAGVAAKAATAAGATGGGAGGGAAVAIGGTALGGAVGGGGLAVSISAAAKAVVLLAVVGSAGYGVHRVTQPRRENAALVTTKENPASAIDRAQTSVVRTQVGPSVTTPSDTRVAEPPINAISVDSLPPAPPNFGSSAPKRKATEIAEPAKVETRASDEAVLEPSAPKTTSETSSIAEEVSGLRQAHLALAKGDATLAMTLLQAHAARFPKSSLAEERDAEMIFTLAALGKKSEATARASEFLRAHPSSPLAARVKNITVP